MSANGKSFTFLPKRRKRLNCFENQIDIFLKKCALGCWGCSRRLVQARPKSSRSGLQQSPGADLEHVPDGQLHTRRPRAGPVRLRPLSGQRPGSGRHPGLRVLRPPVQLRHGHLHCTRSFSSWRTTTTIASSFSRLSKASRPCRSHRPSTP